MTEKDEAGHWSGVTAALPDASVAQAIDFRAIYRSQFPFVWRLLRRLGIHRDSLDDAEQDVFLVVHRRLAEFRQHGDGRQLLAAIALRVARTHRRRHSRKESALEPLNAALPSTADTPLDVAARRQAAELALKYLDEMDDEKREVFVMAELEGLTAPEIGTLLEVNVNTVYSRLRAARASFEASVQTHRREHAP